MPSRVIILPRGSFFLQLTGPGGTGVLTGGPTKSKEKKRDPIPQEKPNFLSIKPAGIISEVGISKWKNHEDRPALSPSSKKSNTRSQREGGETHSIGIDSLSGKKRKKNMTKVE